MECRESAAFEIGVRAGYGDVVLDLNGDFDMSEVAAFRSCMDGVIASCDGAVVVDLADVGFIDSTAISALLIARRRLAADGRELRLRHVSAPVSRIFEMAGLAKLLADTDETAAPPGPN
jgi:anti-sigma B factor antagonist